MTWINADDRIEQGAFSTVDQILGKYGSVQWICGRGAIIDESGAAMHIRETRPYIRSSIRNGIYNGCYSADIIMQEGIFWRSDLWQKVGGLDQRYLLAGDFDLWRRFAEETDLVMIDATIGYFRCREGQLSSDLEKYRAEIAEHSPDHVKRPRRLAILNERYGFVRYRRAIRYYKEDWKLYSYLTFRRGDRIEKVRSRVEEPATAYG